MNEEEKAATRALQTRNLQAALARPADLLVLDEACAAWELDMVDRALLEQAVRSRPQSLEVVLTGRHPAPWMEKLADYSTEMRCHRHPYARGHRRTQGGGILSGTKHRLPGDIERTQPGHHRRRAGGAGHRHSP